MEHMEHMDLQVCRSIISNMTDEKQKTAKEMFSTMATIDGYVDPREQQLLETL